MWPFKQNPVRKFLWDKMLVCSTADGRRIVGEALVLQREYPNLSGPELLRLAYWGSSGTPEGNDG